MCMMRLEQPMLAPRHRDRMRGRRAALVVALALVGACSSRVRGGPATCRAGSDVPGAWQLVREEVRRLDTGDLIDSLTSDRTVGRLVYDRSGRMEVQIDRRAWAPRWPYLGYYGTYTVDRARRTIAHTVEASSNDYRGTVQTRRYALDRDGQQLTLFTDIDGEPRREARLTWRRLPTCD
jgi:hypothetical protein